MEWIGSVITAVINAGWKIYLAAFIASGTLLGMPDSMVARFGLGEIRQTYRTQAGVVLVIAASLLLTSIISAVATVILTPWRNWRFKRQIFNILSELTYDEKAFLIPFIFKGENTRYADFHDGVAKGLEAKLILYRSSTISAPGGAFPYNLQPYARKILNEHQDLLHA
jgi:Super-infection exclusion protein B